MEAMDEDEWLEHLEEHLKEIVNFLIDEFRDEAVNISLPSLRSMHLLSML